MPAILQNSRDFALTTDFPLDKVVYMTSGQVTVPAFNNATQTIPHGLSFAPLLVGSWSFSPSFDTSYEGGNIFYGDPNVCYVSFESNSSDIIVYTINNTSSTRTIYWRTYGFIQPSISALAPFTSSIADDFVINTDYNYTKLYMFGEINISGSGSVIHNLGYRPQVDVWAYIPSISRWVRVDIGSANPSDTQLDRVYVRDDRVDFIQGASSNITKYVYRIYLDE